MIEPDFENEGVPSVPMQEFYREQGRSEERQKLVEIIRTELLWKTQDEGFIGALEWMLGELGFKRR